MITEGAAWGQPPSGPVELEVTGDDADLAAAVAQRPGVRVRFVPVGSDLARTIGLASRRPDAGIEVGLDVLDTTVGPAVNVVTVGADPDRTTFLTPRRPVVVTVDGRTFFEGRATGVVVANGQFLRGADLVPRGHPGDGRIEVQVYALARSARRAMRRRLPTGAHVPHPDLRTTSGRRVEIRTTRLVRVALDGHPRGSSAHLDVEVRPEAMRLRL